MLLKAAIESLLWKHYCFFSESRLVLTKQIDLSF